MSHVFACAPARLYGLYPLVCDSAPCHANWWEVQPCCDIGPFPQLLLSHLLVLCRRDLCVLLWCCSHVFHSTRLLIKISFVFCQAVILNKSMGLNWSALGEWQMVHRLKWSNKDNTERHTNAIPLYTHTYIRVTCHTPSPLHSSGDQRQYVKPQCGRGPL